MLDINFSVHKFRLWYHTQEIFSQVRAQYSTCKLIPTRMHKLARVETLLYRAKKVCLSSLVL